MKKILFFPFLRMPTGHHQVADTLSGYVEKRANVVCKKIDLLSEWNPWVENAVTKTYLQWIHYAPKTYEWAYRQFAYSSRSGQSFRFNELLFLSKMEKILAMEQPDLIVCTHGFPSHLISRLKVMGKCKAPVINVYTDFFINDVWGRDGIDYHFVSNRVMKRNLMKAAGISENQIFVTGVPVDESFDTSDLQWREKDKYHILVSGGSGGLGSIYDVLDEASGRAKYFILCGNNKKLHRELSRLRSDDIQPLPYISSRTQMNELYNQVDAIVTKPGGVTVSEALKKRLPIFIHSALPGQEDINLRYLLKQNIVYKLDDSKMMEEQITGVLSDRLELAKMQEAAQKHSSEMELSGPEEIFGFVHDCILSSSKSSSVV